VQIDAELRLEDEKKAELHDLTQKKLENMPIVYEYLDVFQMSCQDCHQIGTLSF
jgi:hypothetical protein